MKNPQYIMHSDKIERLLLEYGQYATVFYPVKCNDNLELLSLLEKQNVCFEVETLDHLQILEMVGVNMDRVLYFSPFSDSVELCSACGKGVSFFVVDSLDTLISLDDICKEYRFLIRLREQSVSSSQKMFGATKDDAVRMVTYASKGRFVGFSFYLNAEINTFSNRLLMIDEISDLINGMDETVQYIDIGGGVKPSDCVALSKCITSRLNCSMLVEPGRDFLNPCIDLVATVLAVDDANSVAYLNVGIYNGLLDVVIKKRVFDIVPVDESNKKTRFYQVSGPTADQSDMIGRYLLPELKAGDKLLIKQCGAYSEVLSTSFYHLPKANIVSK